MLARSGDIRDQILQWSKIDRNFSGGTTFLVRPPEFWDLHYKIQAGFDHRAKFQGNQSRDLGERVAKKRNITSIL